MTQPLTVHFLPELLTTTLNDKDTSVIIDVLRASTTIITALHHGAANVRPFSEPDDAWEWKRATAADVLLGGERGGIRIAGFDLGNSPADYTPQRVAGHEIGFTTTNGTRALLRAAECGQILIGAFVNHRAVTSTLLNAQGPVHLICAGTDHIITGEDVLFAGSVVEAMTRADPGRFVLDDSAVIANRYWQSAVTQGRTPENIASCLQDTRGGKNLISLGFESDILLCSRMDVIGVIPHYDRTDGTLKLRP